MSEEVVTKFAQKLASNETKIRARALKKLRKWLSHKSELPNGLTEAELLKLWKGLHYCMWMSDKPVVQEELADSLSNLVHVFPDLRSSLQFVSAYFNTQIREWNGIDRLRLDKYMMLMRKYLHQSFVLVRQRKWKKENVKQLVQMLTEVGAMGSKVDGVPDGLRFHVADIYLEELAKVGAKQLDSKKALLFLDTYCTMLTVEKNKLMVKYVIKHVFEVIISQAVDRLTREQEESSQDSDGEEDMEVDTQKQQQPSTDSIKFDCESLGEKLFKLASSDDCLGRNRKLVYNLVKKFKSLAEGIIPVDQSTLPVVDSESDLSDTDVQGAVHRLVAMEDRIVLGERKRKELVKKRKKNKNSEAADTQEEPSAKKAKVEVETEKKKKGKNKFKDSEDEKQKAKDKSIDKKSANKKIKESTEVEEVDDDELDSDDVVFDDDTDDEFSDEESDDVVHIGGEDQDSDGSESLEDDSESEAESETETKVPAKTVKTTVTKLSMGNKKKKSNKSGNKLGDSTPLFEGGFMDSESSDEESNVTSPSISSPSKNNSIAKGGKKDKNDKLTPKSKKEKSASSKVEFTPLFTGGFMDSDEEIEAPAPNSHNKGSSKKNKTKFETKGSAKKSKAKSENSDEEVEPVTPKSDGLTKDSHSSSEKKQKKKNKLNNSELNSSLPNDKGSSKKDKTKSETKGSVKKSKPKSGNIEDIAIEKQLTSDKSTVVSVLSDSQGKKKKKQSQSNGDIIGDNTEMNVNNNMNTISSKKGKKKSAASKLNLTINAMPEMNTSISKSAEKGQKKRRKSESDLAENGDVDEDGDVEIYVPNKKYKGKLKEWAEEQAKLSIGSGKKKKGASSRDDDVEMNVANGSGEGKENEGKKKKVKGKQEFMKFEKLSKTPPAFVKKSVLKATPKTEPKKSSKKEVDTDLPNSAGKRRVSFGLHKNMAQSTSEYAKVIKQTPDVPFNPEIRPDGGILKPTSPQSTPKSHPLRQKLFTNSSGKKKGKNKRKARMSAEEFF